jgi:hypothetical protein
LLLSPVLRCRGRTCASLFVVLPCVLLQGGRQLVCFLPCAQLKGVYHLVSYSLVKVSAIWTFKTFGCVHKYVSNPLCVAPRCRGSYSSAMCHVLGTWFPCFLHSAMPCHSVMHGLQAGAIRFNHLSSSV